MKKYVKASDDAMFTDDLFNTCVYEAVEGTRNYIEAGEAWSYDDVASEVYAEIDMYCEAMGVEITDHLIDEIYESVMNELQDEGFIDHVRGILLYSGDED